MKTTRTEKALLAVKRKREAAETRFIERYKTEHERLSGLGFCSTEAVIRAVSEIYEYRAVQHQFEKVMGRGDTGYE